MIGDFHFLRPWAWLLLPLALWLATRAGAGGRTGDWRHVVDAHLLPHLLEGGGNGKRPATRLWAGLGLILAIFALAGPSWERLPAPAFRPDSPPLILALDLSRSMDSMDVEPSRLKLAKARLLALLENLPPREIGLVVFAARAHQALPLVEDAGIVSALLAGLDSSIMPEQGSHPADALRLSGEMIERSGHRRGDILLVADGADEAAAETAARLAKRGIRVFVLGVGTAGGGPIPLPNGEYFTQGGRLIQPPLEAARLREVARAGEGAYFTEAETGQLAGRLARPQGFSARPDGETGAERWRDMGPWFLLPLLPLAALAFRRGWLVLLLFLSAAPPVKAGDWIDLWFTPDQRGKRLLENGQPFEAARYFADPLWRGVAHYRAGEFEEAVRNFAAADSAAAHYNRGLSLARLRNWPEALEAFSAALERDPGLEDARHNLRLIERELARPDFTRRSEQRKAAPYVKEDEEKALPEDSPGDAVRPEEQANLREAPPTGQQKPGEGTKQRQGRSEGGGAKGDQGGEESAGRSGRSGRPEEKAEEGPESQRRQGSPGASGQSSPGGTPKEGEAGLPPREISPQPVEREAAAGEERHLPGSPPPRETKSGTGTARPQSGKEDAQDDETGEEEEEIGPSATPPPDQPTEGREYAQARDQWLERIVDNPAALLKEKFRREGRRPLETSARSKDPW